jgi:hypothetical protein
MKRRKLIALVSLITLLVIGAVVTTVVVVVTRTDWGHRRLARVIDEALEGRCRCSVYVGRVTASLGEITIDSVAIVDEHGDRFFSAHQLRAAFDIRDLMDNRLLIRAVDLDDPYLHLAQSDSGMWNFKRIFKLDVKKPEPDPLIKRPPGLGDFVVLDSVRLHRGEVVVSNRWRPADSLSGARRDSSIRYHLTRTDQRYLRSRDGFVHRREFKRINAYLPHVRLAHPDSAGEQFIVIGDLAADATDPPLRIRNASGDVRRLKDSVWLDIGHFDLPGSTGSAKGKVLVEGGRPSRYDIAIRGDSMQMKDIAWVYPTLPKTGGGKLLLTIKTDLRNDDVIDYALSRMDVRTTGSRVTGGMTFTVGGPVLAIKNVNLQMDPVDFDLIRTFAAGPLLTGDRDWQGGLYGTVRARGGPLTDFHVDEMRAEWRDTRVRGAVSRFAGRGGLNILSPARAIFRGFAVDVGSLDLRSFVSLFPAFPRLGGTVTGTAVLDSIWTDVRFSNADLTHRDGPGEPSRVTGDGRVTTGDVMSYDVALDAKQISFDMLRRSYDSLPFKGIFRGPIRAKGTAPDLGLTFSLAGDAGTITFVDGRVDIDSVGGYRVEGKGDVGALDLGRLLVGGRTRSALNGRYDVSLAGTTLPSLSGRLLVDLEQSRVDTLRIDRAHARVLFANGQMKLAEPLTLQNAVGSFSATGGIGLPRGTPDTLRFRVDDIDLGALRQYFDAFTPRDSLSARMFSIDTGSTISGRLDSLSIRGRFTGNSLAILSTRITDLAGRFDFDLAPSLVPRNGSLTLGGRDVMAGGLVFDSVGFLMRFDDSTSGTFALGIPDSLRRPEVDVSGRWSRLGGATQLGIIDARVSLPNTDWRLERPTSIWLDSTVKRFDPIVLTDGNGGAARLSGSVPAAGSSDVTFTVDRLRLDDVAAVTRGAFGYGGLADFRATATGPSNAPVIELSSTIDRLTFSPTVFDTIAIGNATATGRYANGRLLMNGGLRVADTTTSITATANVPLDLTLFSARARPDDPLAISVTGKRASLSLFNPFLSGIRAEAGFASGQIDFTGKWADLRAKGDVQLAEGRFVIDSLFTAYDDVAGLLHLHGDTVEIDRDSALIAKTCLTADRVRGCKVDNTGNARVTGLVAEWRKQTVGSCRADRNPLLDLSVTADRLQVVNDPALMKVAVTTSDARLTGRLCSADLSGNITLPFARFFTPSPEETSPDQVRFELSLANAASQRRDSASYVDAMIRNMQFRDLQLALGDVGLESAKSDLVAVRFGLAPPKIEVKLASPRGLTVYRDTVNVDPTAAAILPEAYRGIGLVGEVQPVSGTFVLAGLNERTFDVMSQGSTIKFDQTLNADLNITARATVPIRDRDQRMGILATLRGRLFENWAIGLSPENPNDVISDTELASYLVTGQPSFALDASGAALVTAFATQLGFGSSRVSRAVFGSLGLTGLHFEGASNLPLDSLANPLSYLRKSRVAYEVPFAHERGLLRVASGLCTLFKAPKELDAQAIGYGLAFNASYLLTEPELGRTVPRTKSTTFRLFREPANSQQCTPGTQSLTGLAPLPQSVGFSFLTTWRW